MCYYISTEGKNPWYIICSVICTRRNNIGTDKKYVNDDEKHAPELKYMYMGFLNISNKLVCGDHKYDSTPATYIDWGGGGG